MSIYWCNQDSEGKWDEKEIKNEKVLGCEGNILRSVIKAWE